MIKISKELGISFESNEIVAMDENNTVTRTKVEPRIMRVLEILVNNSPHVVSREELISEVWDDYGGADDALNQAISHLRKLINDTNKEDRIIETVVKKGYRFNQGEFAFQRQTERTHSRNKPLLISILVIGIMLLMIAGLLYFWYSNSSQVPVAPIPDKVSTETPAPEADSN